MVVFILRRLLWIAFSLLCVSIITFLLIFASPGDPASMLVPKRPGQDRQDPELVARIRAQYGLDQPLYIQYAKYMGQLVRGDFGYSYYYKRPVLNVLLDKFPSTALLATSILLTAILIGIPLGILTALRNNTLFDRAFTVVGMLIISVPSFLLALLLIFIFAYQIKIFPSSGYGTPLHLVLPTLSVAMPMGVYYAVFLRTNMLNAMQSDYVRTAYAKGLSERVAALRHTLPNAVLPVVTLASLDLAALLTGLVLVETAFSWPGIGFQALQASRAKDIPVVMGSVFFAGLLISIGNLLADLLAVWLDPRVQLK